MANHCRPQPRCERQDPEPQPCRGALGFLQHDEEEQERQPDSRRTGSRSKSTRSTKTWLTFHFLLVTSERLLVRITDWRLNGGAWRRRNGYWSNVGRALANFVRKGTIKIPERRRSVMLQSSEVRPAS